MEKLLTVISCLAVGGIIVAAGIIAFSNKKKTRSSKSIVYAAVCIAMSFVLSYIKYEFPFGGSITLASFVPIVLYSFCFGMPYGLLAGAVYGLLQFLQSPWYINFFQFILDYMLAFMSIAVAGLFNKMKNRKAGIMVGMCCVSFTRFISHFLAGILFYSEVGSRAEILPSIIGNVDALPAVVYSLVYNGLYVIPDLIIAIIAFALMTNNKIFMSKVNEMIVLGRTEKIVMSEPVIVDSLEKNQEISDTENNVEQSQEEQNDIKE